MFDAVSSGSFIGSYITTGR